MARQANTRIQRKVPHQAWMRGVAKNRFQPLTVKPENADSDNWKQEFLGLWAAIALLSMDDNKLTAMFDEPGSYEMFEETLNGISHAHQRFEAAAKALETAQARLLVAGSRLATGSALA